MVIMVELSYEQYIVTPICLPAEAKVMGTRVFERSQSRSFER